MPAAAPFAPIIGGALGLGATLLDKPSANEQRAGQANTEAAQAQAAEVQRQTELARFLEDLFRGQYANAAPTDPSMFVGSDAGLMSANSAGVKQNMALNRLMGLTGSTGTGVLQGVGNQAFLTDQQRLQDITGAAEGLAESILAKYGVAPGAAVAETKKIEDLFDPVAVTQTGPVQNPNL